MLILPATPEVITGFIEAAEAAPEELSTIANVMLAPPMPFIPEEAHGKPVLMGLLAYVGPLDQAEEVLAPFRALGKPYADMVRPMRYPEIYEGQEPEVRVSRPGPTSSPTRSSRPTRRRSSSSSTSRRR